MPIPEKYLAPFAENEIYHIFNRTNNRESLFLSDDNRFFFLKKYKEYLSGFLDTYCWCLLPNHFHLLVKVKPAANIIASLQNKDTALMSGLEKDFLNGTETVNTLVSQGFKHFFQSYHFIFQ